MAITQVQKPSGFVGVNGRLIVTLTSGNVSEPKFRFKVSLYKDGTTLISTSYIDPDPNDFGVYDCSPRLQGLVSPQLHDGNTPATRVSIFDLAVDEAFVKPVGAHEEITVELDESYAATVDDEPVDQGINDTFTFTIYAGSTIIEQGLNVNTGYGVFDAASAPSLIDVTAMDSFGFREIRLGNNDRLCLGWFNDNEDSVECIKWRMVASIGGVIQTPEDIDLASFTTGAGDGTTVYFMCGPKDLSDFTGITAGIRPSSAIDWDYYILQPFDASTAIGGAYKIIQNDCTRYDSYQLAFPNRHGAWNFQTFNLVSKKTVEAKGGKTFMRQVGDTNYGNSEYGFDIYDREVGQYGIESKVKLELNSNWLTREEALDLEAVIYSRDVRMILNGSVIPVPVVVSNRSHRFDKYEKMRQYKITVEVAQRHYNL